MPKGIVMPELDVGTFTSSFFDPAILRLAIGYGVTDDLELGFAGYTFTTDDAGKGSIDANIGYKLARGAAGGKLEVIGRVQVGYALAGKVDLTTGDTEGAVKPVGLGVHVQYNVTDKIAVITPGQQLQIGVEDPQPIALGLPVALGFQATPELYAQLDTTLATIELKDSDTTVIFSDTTPLALTGIYNVMPALDVFASLALDASADEVGDSLALTVGARYYAGKL